jgi:Protein of unknown function (DUF2909)
MRLIVLLFIAVILISLFSALYFLWKDRGGSERTVRALTIRIMLSIVLFGLLIAGYQLGFIGHRL